MSDDTAREIREVHDIVNVHLKAMMQELAGSRVGLRPLVANGAIAMMLITYMRHHPDREADLQEHINVLLGQFCPSWRLVRIE